MAIHSLLVLPFKLQMLLVGIFIFLVWFFVLRKYNSLGLRMFFLFTTMAALACSWLYTDIQQNKSMEKNGHLVSAMVIEKSKTKSESGGSQDNQITIAFDDGTGNKQVIKTHEYISIEEYEALAMGQKIDVWYNPTNTQAYYKVSYDRYKHDQWFLYALPAFFFLVGSILGVALRKYKVGVHAETGDEYIEKDGRVILDERRSPAARTLKRVNIASKMFQALK